MANNQSNDFSNDVKPPKCLNYSSGFSFVDSEPVSKSVEKLPFEVKLIILQALSNPRDVYTLIRASPIFYQVFRGYKPKILAAAVSQAILPESRPLALLVCKAREKLSAQAVWEQYQTKVKRRRTSKSISDNEVKCRDSCDERNRNFIGDDGSGSDRSIAKEDKMVDEDYASRVASDDDSDYWSYPEDWTYNYLMTIRRECFFFTYNDVSAIWKADVDLRDELVVMKLCRLCCLTDYFVWDYVRYARTQLETPECVELEPAGGRQVTLIPNELSAAEYGRLQRAFLYLELFRYLFGAFKWHRDVMDDSIAPTIRPYNKLYRIFFGWMTGFEQTELLSVSEYLMSDMGRQFDTIEDHAITQIRRAAALRSESEDSKINHDFGEVNIQPQSGHFGCLPFLQKRNRYWHRGCLSEIVDLGLPFYRHFSQLNRPIQLRVLNDYVWSHHHYWSINRHVIHRPWRGPDYGYRAEYRELGKTITAPSTGYEHLYASKKGKITQKVKYNLRQCGYLFWDHVVAPCHIESSNLYNSNNPNKTHDRRQDPSVEERLYGTKITRHDLQEALSPSLSPKEIIDMVENCEKLKVTTTASHGGKRYNDYYRS